ncbi:ROK family protein [Rhodococcus sp. HNM0569]|uniref:ROK family protein n=1 Tax=Rhodococcus sp. HNM0569 TaxID=2716340 RepID=UPI00146D024E|nr:ROK family protein [Rhodococcus sp. HNM0569]NLU82895.1 ROK family protein [Rhodococcus sp. HNM0569]
MERVDGAGGGPGPAALLGPTVGVDVGGTSIRGAVVTPSGDVVDTVTAPTPHSAPALEDGIARVVAELRERHEVHAVGLALAGFLDEHRRTVRFAPHLPWRDVAVGGLMQDRIGLPVVLEHDANAAALAEHRFGAASGARNAVVVAIGTGIGAALVQHGELYRGSFGVAPELGHLQVVPDGRPCACGKRGCWERSCSGTALVETALEFLASEAHPESSLARDVRSDRGALTGRRIAAAAHDGDPLARAVVDDFAQWLGVGLAFVADVFDPDVVVVSGGVAGSAPLFLDAAREICAAHATGAGHRPLARIRSTQLGDYAGLIGAAVAAHEQAGT